MSATMLETSTPEVTKKSPEIRKPGLLMLTVCLAQLIVVLDASIVNIALPTAQMDLGFSEHNRQWLVTAYSIAFGSLLLLGGRLVNLWGRKFTFILALVGFAVTSALGGAATGFEMLVIGRAGQGVFAALLAPAALSILGYSFTDPATRGKAFGVFGAVAGAGGAIGLILGGTLTQFISWRWCMYVNVPLAAVTILGAVMLMPKMPRDRDTKIDWIGAFFSVLGVIALVYGLSLVEVGGWSDPAALAYMIAGIVLLVIFVLTQRVIKNPLLPLSILKDRTRGGANVTVAIISAGMFSMFLFLAFYMSAIKGYSPLLTGVSFLPIAAAIAVAANLSDKLIAKMGTKVPVTAGFVIGAAGMFLLSQMGLDSGYGLHIVPGMILSGFGIGLVMAPAFSCATLGVPQEHDGVASASLNAFQQIGGSMGIAALSAASASAIADYMATSRLSGAALEANAALSGFTSTFGVTVWIFLAGALISVFLLPHGPNKYLAGAMPVARH